MSVDEFDTKRDESSGNVSYPDFLDYRDRNATFVQIAGHNGVSRTLTGDGLAERLTMAEVTTGFFAVLGVRPALGRDFTADDMVAGARARRHPDRRRVAAPLRVGLGGSLVASSPSPGRRRRSWASSRASFRFPIRARAEIWLPASLEPRADGSPLLPLAQSDRPLATRSDSLPGVRGSRANRARFGEADPAHQTSRVVICAAHRSLRRPASTDAAGAPRGVRPAARGVVRQRRRIARRSGRAAASRDVGTSGDWWQRIAARTSVAGRGRRDRHSGRRSSARCWGSAWFGCSWPLCRPGSEMP